MADDLDIWKHMKEKRARERERDGGGFGGRNTQTTGNKQTKTKTKKKKKRKGMMFFNKYCRIYICQSMLGKGTDSGKEDWVRHQRDGTKAKDGLLADLFRSEPGPKKRERERMKENKQEDDDDDEQKRGKI